MTEPLERMREQVAADRRVLEEHLAKLAGLEVNRESAEDRCALVALTLHHVYTALENLLKHVASGFGESFGGERWHGDLLDAMTRPVDPRPAVLSQAVAEPARELLAFRHYLVHGSVIVSPDGERLASIRQRALAAVPQLRLDIDALERHLEAVATSP